MLRTMNYSEGWIWQLRAWCHDAAQAIVEGGGIDPSIAIGMVSAAVVRNAACDPANPVCIMFSTWIPFGHPFGHPLQPSSFFKCTGKLHCSSVPAAVAARPRLPLRLPGILAGHLQDGVPQGLFHLRSQPSSPVCQAICVSAQWTMFRSIQIHVCRWGGGTPPIMAQIHVWVCSCRTRSTPWTGQACKPSCIRLGEPCRS